MTEDKQEDDYYRYLKRQLEPHDFRKKHNDGIQKAVLERFKDHPEVFEMFVHKAMIDRDPRPSEPWDSSWLDAAISLYRHKNGDVPFDKIQGYFDNLAEQDEKWRTPARQVRIAFETLRKQPIDQGTDDQQ